ncbi:MAG: SDR family NAD(P)-dependent oxidoreductase [Bdellovibrionales bacterium]
MKNPRHILITGASSGIGASLAELYAKPNVTLSLHGRNAERLASIADKARRQGAEVAPHAGDVTNANNLAEWIVARHSALPLDLVIANAGISAGAGKNAFETATQSRAVFATNLDGVLNTVYPVIPLMIARKQGQLALVSSVASFRGFPGSASYCASKSAIRALGESWRCDLQRYGIAVNVVCPGFIRTPMTEGNPYPMPWIMEADRAARLIRDGLARNKPCIAFPWRMVAMIGFLNLLPQDWSNAMLRQFPSKPPRQTKT